MFKIKRGPNSRFGLVDELRVLAHYLVRNRGSKEKLARVLSLKSSVESQRIESREGDRICPLCDGRITAFDALVVLRTSGHAIHAVCEEAWDVVDESIESEVWHERES
jgi:hypothetical protein